MSYWKLLLLFVLLFAWYAAGDWSLPLVDRDEPRFAEASREMLERGDFVVPYFNGQTRFDKPPLIYWMQCAMYRAIGDNEMAARLPSALAGALAAVAIALWGASLYGPAAGFRAAMMFGLCAQVFVHAHAAVADMAMIAAATAAAWAGWNWLNAGRARLRWGAAFWILLAIGFLAKGPIAWVPLGMTGWTARRIGPQARPRTWEWFGGAVLMLALIGVWGIPALIRTHGAYAAVGLGRHVVMRSVAPMEGHGAHNWWSYAASIPFYFLTIWPSFFPWSFQLPGAARSLWNRRRALTLDETYLVTGIVLVFVIFTLSRTKLPHYTLPAFPFIALLIASRSRTEKTRVFGAIAACTALSGFAVSLIGFPLLAPLFVSQALYQKAAPYLTPAMQMTTVDYHEPSLVWLFREKVRGYDSQVNRDEANDWMNQPGPRVCILPSVELGEVFKNPVPAKNPDPAWKIVQAGGYQVARARRMPLAAVIKQ